MASVTLPDLDMGDFNLIIANKEVDIRRRDKLIAALTEEIEARDEALGACETRILALEERIIALEDQLSRVLPPSQEPVTPGQIAPEKEENSSAAPTPTP